MNRTSLVSCALVLSSLILAGCGAERIESKYPDGKPMVIRKYNPLSVVTPENMRRQQTFFFNGNKESDGYYRDGQLHGKYEDYWHNGQLKSKGKYKKGKKEGEWEFRYNQFTVSSKGRFKNDLKEGPWSSFWENGALKAQGDFKAGKETGTWKEWSAKGDPLIENSCFESNPTGKFISFHANKTVKEEYECRAGNPSGAYLKKDPDGVIVEKGSFDAKGRKDGKWEAFHSEGVPASVKRYAGGLEHDSSFAWDAAGRLTEKSLFDSGTGERVAYDSLGHIIERRHFLKGQPDGELWAYWPIGGKGGRVESQGPKRAVIIYKDGKPVEQRKWHPNGKPMSQGMFLKGHRDGEWKDWWESGALKDVYRFKEGALHGERMFYDSTGKLMRTTRYEHGYPAEGKIPKGLLGTRRPKGSSPDVEPSDSLRGPDTGSSAGKKGAM